MRNKIPVLCILLNNSEMTEYGDYQRIAEERFGPTRSPTRCSTSSPTNRPMSPGTSLVVDGGQLLGPATASAAAHRAWRADAR